MIRFERHDQHLHQPCGSTSGGARPNGALGWPCEAAFSVLKDDRCRIPYP